MLALCKPYQKFEFYPIRDLPRRRWKSTEQFFGFADLGDDDDYDDQRDPWAGWVGKPRWPRGRVCY